MLYILFALELLVRKLSIVLNRKQNINIIGVGFAIGIYYGYKQTATYLFGYSDISSRRNDGKRRVYWFN